MLDALLAVAALLLFHHGGYVNKANRLFSLLEQHDWHTSSRPHIALAPSTSHSSSALSIPLHRPTSVLLAFLVIFSLCPEHGVCQGSLRSHHMSKPSDLPRDLFPMPWTWRLPGFPSLAPHVQTILPSSWSFPYALNMAFARDPFARTTCPNHLTFLVIFSLRPEHGVCQGSLRSHHTSTPSYLPLLNNLQFQQVT